MNSVQTLFNYIFNMSIIVPRWFGKRDDNNTVHTSQLAENKILRIFVLNVPCVHKMLLGVLSNPF